MDIGNLETFLLIILNYSIRAAKFTAAY